MTFHIFQVYALLFLEEDLSRLIMKTMNNNMYTALTYNINVGRA